MEGAPHSWEESRASSRDAGQKHEKQSVSFVSGGHGSCLTTLRRALAALVVTI